MEARAVPGGAQGCSLEMGARVMEKVAASDRTEGEDVVDYCLRRRVDIVVVGPEQPLVDGLLTNCGPHSLLDHAAAAQSSHQSVCKRFMARHGTASRYCNSRTTLPPSICQNLRHPLVVKASGLAAGRVLIPESLEIDALKDVMLNGAFGAAGSTVVLEEKMQGLRRRAWFCDGETIVAMPAAQDHKRALDGVAPAYGRNGCVCAGTSSYSALAGQIMREVLPSCRGLAWEETFCWCPLCWDDDHGGGPRVVSSTAVWRPRDRFFSRCSAQIF